MPVGFFLAFFGPSRKIPLRVHPFKNSPKKEKRNVNLDGPLSKG